MVGNRRQGKSYLNNYLCQELSGDFDLIISFMGSKHCNPELHNFLESVGLDDFQFDCWDSALMTRLEEQQQDLMRRAGPGGCLYWSTTLPWSTTTARS